MEPNFQLAENCTARVRRVTLLKPNKGMAHDPFQYFKTPLVPHLFLHIHKLTMKWILIPLDLLVIWLMVTAFVSLLAQVAESPDGQEVSTEVTPVPPFAYGVQGLKHSTNYSVRVQCSNEMGSSPFTDRVYFQTLELGKQTADKKRKALH